MAKHSDSNKKEKAASDITEKVLYINRCSKVVTGGRKFSFSALSSPVTVKVKSASASQKLTNLPTLFAKVEKLLKKNLRSYATEGNTIPHEILVEFDGAKLLMKPAPDGAGVIAGSQVRSVLEMAGIKNIMAKSLGCNNLD